MTTNDEKTNRKFALSLHKDQLEKMQSFIHETPKTLDDADIKCALMTLCEKLAALYQLTMDHENL